MVVPSLIWIALIFLCGSFHFSCAVDCFTCSVDFRSQPFEQNNSCLFPTKDNEKTRCSDSSKFCQGVVTRINGVFVQLQRTCETDCTQICVEKGFGIETSECKYCCNKKPDCGKEGYKSSAVHKRQTFLTALIFFILLEILYHKNVL